MRDLIDRQAAIEINQSYHGQMPNEVNHRIWKEINELPSAQPEYTIEMQESDIDKAVKLVRDVRVTILPSAEPEIIRCKECKYAEVADREDSQDGYTCPFHRGSIWFSGSYCSWAKRRTDEQTGNNSE